MIEEFKIIPSFPDYEVSNCGRVRTRARKIRYVHAVSKEEHFRQTEARFLKVQNNDLTGYKFHQLYKNKKMHNKPIHQLVADAFLDPIPGTDSINHKDGNKHNNHLSNLERCTNSYNHEHATKTGLKAKGSQIGGSKLNERCVLVIKKLLNAGWTHTELGKLFEISRESVSLISENKTWKHVEINETRLTPPDN